MSITHETASWRIALQASQLLSEWIGPNLGEECPASRRNSVALALFSIALDHREAVVLLVSAGARSTAFATVRPVFEAYVSGLWASHLATEDELKRFMSGRLDLKVDTTIKRLRKADRSAEVFEKIRLASWESMCDYAHGSARQVTRWIMPNGDVQPRHSDAEVVGLLQFVDQVGLLACISRESLAGRPADKFVEKAREMMAPRVHGTAD